MVGREGQEMIMWRAMISNEFALWNWKGHGLVYVGYCFVPFEEVA